jgi:hypothetical protein
VSVSHKILQMWADRKNTYEIAKVIGWCEADVDRLIRRSLAASIGSAFASDAARHKAGTRPHDSSGAEK